MADVPCCELCAGQETLLIQRTYVNIKSGPLDLVTCRRCGLVYLVPRPDRDELKSLYGEEYFGKWYSAEEKRQSEQQYFRAIFSKYDIRKNAGCRALDVGCGMGSFLQVAAEWGWNATGVELSEHAARHCKENLHLDVRNATLDDAGLPNDHFEVITAFDVLEHLEGLSAFFASVKRLLKTKGRFIVLVPNYDGVVFQFGRILHKLKKLPLPNTPEHLTYFTMRSLRQLLYRNGFSVNFITTTDPNDLGDYLRCRGSLMAGLRTVANYTCSQIGKITNRRESILVVAEKSFG
jgi:2-polyprenyl-3-methyl-5-hydroxy-6-metoxy-1,4-benzoquinol methylase